MFIINIIEFFRCRMESKNSSVTYVADTIVGDKCQKHFLFLSPILSVTHVSDKYVLVWTRLNNEIQGEHPAATAADVHNTRTHCYFGNKFKRNDKFARIKQRARRTHISYTVRERTIRFFLNVSVRNVFACHGFAGGSMRYGTAPTRTCVC